MGKFNLRLIFSLTILVGIVGWFLVSKNYLTCQVIYKADKSIEVNGSIIAAEVADEPPAREKGLSGRTCIGEGQGMLFIFERPGQYAIWMKDMKFPIDIIWISESKRVVKVQPNVSENTYPQTFVNEAPAKYVLELKAGKASDVGINVGTTVRL